MTLDHLEYITSRKYRRLTHAAIRKLKFGLTDLHVLHEADRSCCRLQSWPDTSTKLIGAMNLDGHRTVAVPRTDA